MKNLSYTPIGIIRSKFMQPEGTPIQSTASDSKGTIIVYPEYVPGLKDLQHFSHIILIYHFHQTKKMGLLVKPFLDDEKHGVFATRAPCRPNPIGLSVVRLLRVEENILHVAQIDIVDGTPLLDIKPYVEAFDVYMTQRNGWLSSRVNKLDNTRDDGRFKGQKSSGGGK